MLALPAGGGYDYRGTVSVWFRGLFALGPRPEVIAYAPLLFRPHAPSACPLFAARPFTRLVHVWSAPVGYLVRPCSVHRRRATPARASRTRSTTGRWSGDDDGLVLCGGTDHDVAHVDAVGLLDGEGDRAGHGLRRDGDPVPGVEDLGPGPGVRDAVREVRVDEPR
ncbi:respiratory nitrate reductase [Streptomyces lividans TK24]|uniref:Respiratory nitrate reductase n=1 Tax=Streptomyces lividans TK24 TaxID=457428 RepID=A0ABM5RC23_STRLI|nr:respiratory nitrate reductase [Streptomyces lividans TK24]QSJ13563.1 respiratory nitrate reductase [Streptomyces lividans]QTD74473.1 respiratory nitrate reductase [Streptomyces lividans TK24] [Streptomyces lividans]